MSRRHHIPGPTEAIIAELEAMARIAEVLQPMAPEARARVLRWARAQAVHMRRELAGRKPDAAGPHPTRPKPCR